MKTDYLFGVSAFSSLAPDGVAASDLLSEPVASAWSCEHDLPAPWEEQQALDALPEQALAEEAPALLLQQAGLAGVSAAGARASAAGLSAEIAALAGSCPAASRSAVCARVAVTAIKLKAANNNNFFMCVSDLIEFHCMIERSNLQIVMKKSTIPGIFYSFVFSRIEPFSAPGPLKAFRLR